MLIYTFTDKKVTIFYDVVFSMVPFGIGCHGNVFLEPNISLLLALVDPIGIVLNSYVLRRSCATSRKKRFVNDIFRIFQLIVQYVCCHGDINYEHYIICIYYA